MSPADTTAIERYRPYRRRAEIVFWVVILTAQAAANTLVVWLDLQRVGRPAALWQPAVWEVSSNLAIGLLLPAVVAFERRFPIRLDTLRAHLPWHLAGSVAFCAGHVLLMLGMRHAAYAAAGARYDIGPLAQALSYEYLKDLRTYVMILAALVSYRFFLLRLQGEARLLDAPPVPADPAPSAAPPRPERFLVRQLRKEFLIAAVDIEWLQAQGNYVALHVGGRAYLLRSTLADVMQQLDPAKFARVHRSHAVQLDGVAEIEPTDGGDARLRMKSGAVVPCSRRYRAALTDAALRGAAAADEDIAA